METATGAFDDALDQEGKAKFNYLLEMVDEKRQEEKPSSDGSMLHFSSSGELSEELASDHSGETSEADSTAFSRRNPSSSMFKFGAEFRRPCADFGEEASAFVPCTRVYDVDSVVHADDAASTLATFAARVAVMDLEKQDDLQPFKENGVEVDVVAEEPRRSPGDVDDNNQDDQIVALLCRSEKQKERRNTSWLPNFDEEYVGASILLEPGCECRFHGF